jgi:hypothetical protein
MVRSMRVESAASHILVIGDVMTDVIVRPEGPLGPTRLDHGSAGRFRGQSVGVARRFRRSPRRCPVLT